MHKETLKEVVQECAEQLDGRSLGKVFQLSDLILVLDFGLREGLYLLISVEPQSPRLHLVMRRVRDLEKQSNPHGPFAQALRSNLSGAELLSISLYDAERVVSLQFSRPDETGIYHKSTVLAQLTGRSANLLLLDGDGLIKHALRTPRGSGQQIGEIYQPPPRQTSKATEEPIIKRGEFSSVSAAVDHYFAQRDLEESFRSRVQGVRDRLRRQSAQKEKLLTNLEKDLEAHGDAEKHKRLGDLLLANVATAERFGKRVRLKDYYSDGAPEIELEVDENTSLKDEAARYFARYTKAKRGKEEISRRVETIKQELAELRKKQAAIEEVASTHDESALETLEEGRVQTTVSRRKKGAEEKIPGVRRYRSSDGYEILVGRAAHTNDRLTFKVARPHDLWLHAADYPGSHVIIRNSSRNEIPQRTIFEAAALAAKFSQASEDAKVDVHYTQRKYLSKPRGAAPGLVRMSSFRTVTVQPAETVNRVV